MPAKSCVLLQSYAKDIDTNKKLLAAAEEASRLPSLAPSGGGKEEGDRRASSELEMLQRVEGLLPESLVKSTAKRSQLDGSSVSAKHLPALRAVVAEQRVLAGAEFALRRAARAA